MGGLGPGIGGMEILVIGLVALLVVGPKDLPMLMRKIGQFVAKARGLANEFRSSFDEMARQSELDDLRKEVEALRSGQGMLPLGAEAEATFKDIRDEMNKPLDAPATQPVLTGPEEWPEPAAPEPAAAEPAMSEAAAVQPPASAEAAPAKPAKTKAASAKTAAAAKPKPKTSAPRSKTARTKKVEL
jgi:sec-independent protein translocase protein TatB